MITVYNMDVIKALKQMPSESVDMSITSPPYWGLRDYGVDGQIGLEPDFNDFIKKLCDIYDEVNRVTKDDGTCWVNLGDSYYSKSGSGTGSNFEEKHKTLDGGRGKLTHMHQHKTDLKILKEKCLVCIPERFCLEMINRGWILRNKIIWHKPNHMPTSVQDRFCNSWEYLFFFSKSKKYYFDLDAVREPHQTNSIKRACRARTSEKLDIGQYSTSYKCNNVGYDDIDGKLERGELRAVNPLGKNPDDIDDYWDITTKGVPEAHFATFPEKLITRPIKTTKKDAVILDPFVGSGTTLKVARRLGRDSIGIEINPEYVEIIKKRLFNGNLPLFPNEFKIIK